MSNLVQRLRIQAAEWSDGSGGIPICREAADIIEDLEYQLRDYADANANANKRIAELEAQLKQSLVEAGATILRGLELAQRQGERIAELEAELDRAKVAMVEAMRVPWK